MTLLLILIECNSISVYLLHTEKFKRTFKLSAWILFSDWLGGNNYVPLERINNTQFTHSGQYLEKCNKYTQLSTQLNITTRGCHIHIRVYGYRATFFVISGRSQVTAKTIHTYRPEHVTLMPTCTDVEA